MPEPSEPELPVVDDPIAVDVINDPLRSRIIGQLAWPKTVRELSEIFDLRPARLYYHLNLLEKHGWIKRLDGAEVGDARSYVHAYPLGGFRFGKTIFEQPGYEQHGMWLGAVRDTFEPFERNLDLLIEQGYPDGAVATSTMQFARLPADRAKEMLRRVREVLAEYLPTRVEFAAAEANGENADQLYGVLWKVEPFMELPTWLPADTRTA